MSTDLPTDPHGVPAKKSDAHLQPLGPYLKITDFIFNNKKPDSKSPCPVWRMCAIPQLMICCQWKETSVPDQPLWYPRVPQILAALENSRTAVLDRFAMEKLFQVSRRQAVRLMGGFGGYQVGRTYVVPKEEVVQRLKQIEQGGEAESALRQKQRVWRILQQERASLPGRAIEIPLPVQPLVPEIANLPTGIQLENGLLTIRFDAPVELLQKLFALSQALMQDYETFERRCGGKQSNAPT